ncbi:MAG: hypothetical protein J2P36_11750 [Ktedonobacteraceae bacterium]|nr:hypothetical protein [Ktedonobacteraceae bacterium]
MNQQMSDDQHQPSLGMQKAASHSRRVFLLGVLCGLVPFFLILLTLFSKGEEAALAGFLSALLVELLATLLLVPLSLFAQSRPLASGLFLPCVLVVCFETFGHFTLQPITACTSIQLLLAAAILFVSWLRKRASAG